MSNKLNDPSIMQRVEVMLQKMSLEQKIGQMTQAERMSCTPEEVKEYHLGSVLSGGGSCPGENRPADWVSMNDAYWAASMSSEEGYLPIPLIYGVDAIHGNSNVLGATIYPHNIGLGASRDADLVRRVASNTAREILATGVDWTFAPTLAVARNIQWGRTYESYSEDPSIVGSFAPEFVKGMQGDFGEESVVACVKHWIGDGGTTNGIDQGETSIDEATLRQLHLAPYLGAIEAGVLTVMASFNSWNGDKCHGHKYLLSDVLKEELGFSGFVISDWDGIDYLADDYFDAIALGVNAGIDMFMVSEEWKEFISHLQTHVHNGTVAMSRIDDAVRRILTVKYAHGLFDKPRPAERVLSNSDCFGSAEHRDTAREAVRKSLVLLKNQEQSLPLSKHARILVAGKNANNRGNQCGGFTIAWQGVNDNESIEGGTSIWEGIKEIAPQAELCESEMALGVGMGQYDAAIVVIGELPYAEGMGDVRTGNNVIVEAGSQIKGLMKVLEPYGSSLELSQSHPEDLQTILNLSNLGMPVIVVLISGRPLIVNKEIENADAFVAAWLPGSEGAGIAEVLFGDADFQGKLPFTWPGKTLSSQTIDQADYDALFPIGFGLNYSQ